MKKPIVAEHAKTKIVKSNIFKIAELANKVKKEYDDVIDATVGMLTHEDGRVFKYDAVHELLHTIEDEKYYPYAPINGTLEFTEGIMQWVFGKHLKSIKESMFYKVIPTTGGTAAISNTMYNFNDYNESILIPNYYWPPYENIAHESSLGVETYRMYDENHNFNLKGFKDKAYELAKKQERLFVILNDPCNNPTGLQMGNKNWEKVVEILNEISKEDIPVILVIDIAYIDYQKDGYDASRDFFQHLVNLEDDILTVISFSASKSFSIYGLRLGAQIGLTKNSAIMDEFTRVSEHSVRARFSNVNHPAMTAVARIFNNPEYRQSYLDELRSARQTLEKRAMEFTRIAEREQLEVLPYGGGFFMAIETDNETIFDDLVKERIFVIQFPGLIRIAISSLQFSQMEQLVKALKKYV